ncbi:MAG TPA: DNA adenine methylase [Gemmatimonadales bacterium]|nr:DNA adenine methylase [Gemmatimonadales bacterium]
MFGFYSVPQFLRRERRALSARYLGNKTRLAKSIVTAIRLLNPGRVIDLFSGTGAAASALTRAGIEVLTNDNLVCAGVMTEAACTSQQAVEFRSFPGRHAVERYHSAVRQLNDARQVEGFIWKEYSPSGCARSGHARYYFTCENAASIDGIRDTIGKWRADGTLSQRESALLLGDLLHAVNKVANIAGTYGCFMKPWLAAALRPLTVAPRPLPRRLAPVRVVTGDYWAVPVSADDVVYLDPPYTKRQYAAYYHLLETIAVGDQPLVDGVTGLRPWHALASPYCYSRKAPHELRRFVEACPARALVLSYSNKGHIPHETLLEILRTRGNVTFSEHLIGKYSSNLPRGTNERIVERIYVCGSIDGYVATGETEQLVLIGGED